MGESSVCPGDDDDSLQPVSSLAVLHPAGSVLHANRALVAVGDGLIGSVI